MTPDLSPYLEVIKAREHARKLDALARRLAAQLDPEIPRPVRHHTNAVGPRLGEQRLDEGGELVHRVGERTGRSDGRFVDAGELGAEGRDRRVLGPYEDLFHRSNLIGPRVDADPRELDHLSPRAGSGRRGAGCVTDGRVA